MNRAPVGLFDSGFGGLTVLREVVRELPFENILYLGDTANLPYGNKSPEKIKQLTLESGKFLFTQGIKLLIVACHTASSYALDALQKALPIPVIGMIEPGLQALTQATQTGRVAILGTTSTIQSGIYQKNLPLLNVLPIACPLFVPLIEEGFATHPATELIAREYLKPLIAGLCDSALLACTHYPLIRPLLASLLGPRVALVEPALHCARTAKYLLTQRHLLNGSLQQPGRVFYTTDSPEKFQALGSIFFGEAIDKIELKKTPLPGILSTDRGIGNESEKTDFISRR